VTAWPLGVGETGPILTLTLSPALDISSAVDRVEPWRKLRGDPVHMHAGGGGINVARAIRELGGTPVVVAALGGHVGSLIAEALTTAEIVLRAVRVRGMTRQNFAVTERSSGNQYRFVHPAAAMSRAEWTRCLNATVAAAHGADAVIARPPPVDVISTSGAGDSMVGGLALAVAVGADLTEMARLGVAAGTAAVLAAGTGLCHLADVQRLLSQTTLTT
jgi:fructose-1-phosphate kinase PfkB-like protein